MSNLEFNFSLPEEDDEDEVEDRPVTVGELTSQIKSMLEDGIGFVTVRGEISNWKPAASGHIYFSLKDSDAMISAAFFRGQAAKMRNAAVRDGVEVICRGRISVYPPRGGYQIIVESLEPVGAGTLQAQFEALKKKLHAEGLFESERKRPIPLMPERIVVITSPTGAAVRDVLSVLKRRFAGVKVLVIPCLVQGATAHKELIRALRTANEFKLGDVILLTRGGGSLEDMWCFNDEELAREIYCSQIPVVSAVGHEVDFTIADFVADLRAATPSAAAELLVREKAALSEGVADLQHRLLKSTRHSLAQASMHLRSVSAQLKNPRDRINDLRLRFDDWAERLANATTAGLDRQRNRLGRLESSLNALSPLRVLERGYAIAFGPDGKAVRSSAALPPGTRFNLRLHDGAIAAEAKESQG
ncbi:MAG: exodeoxyribonuclease VII large subunit [Proteobacteria bacterium]|nr:MAG: exodeoxyribonuclease VII large subunit [Pseudomonadota bacterium]